MFCIFTLLREYITISDIMGPSRYLDFGLSRYPKNAVWKESDLFYQGGLWTAISKWFKTFEIFVSYLFSENLSIM